MSRKKLDEGFKLILQNKKNFFEILDIFFPSFVKKCKITPEAINIEKIEHIFPNLSSRRSDMLYLIQTERCKTFIYIIVEHQSTQDNLMPFRICEYYIGVWRRYIQEHKREASRKDFKLPPIVGIVIYDGVKEWQVPTNINDKIEKVKEIEKFIPSCEYMLIDVGRIEWEKYLKEGNIMSMVLMLDGANSEKVREVLKYIKEHVKDIGEGELQRLIDNIRYMLIAHGMLGEVKEELKEFEEVEGVLNILLHDVKQEGLKEAIFDVLEERFGKVPKDIKERVEKINDISTLKNLLRKSATVADIDSFRRLLK